MDSPVTLLIDALTEELSDRKTVIPDRNILESLFSITFYSTLEKDEGEAIRFDLAYLDPVNPDPVPPRRVRSHRWMIVPFAEPLIFNKASLAKVALASDQRTSMLVVYPDEASELKIWGFVDQGTNSYKLRNWESTHGFGYPGLFQLSAIGAGHLIVRIGFEQIAELRGEAIKTKPLELFEEGAIPDALEPVFVRLVRTSAELMSRFNLNRDHENMVEVIAEQTLMSLRRLLLRIQNYGHGGAVLITPKTRARQLNIKHRVDYPRLARAIQKTSVLTERMYEVRKELYGIYEDRSKTSIPIRLHLNSAVITGELEDAQSELEGSLWFVSLLSRVDGLVLMDTSLTVRGFGVEIIVSEIPGNVWLAGDTQGSGNLRVELPYEYYGTRHRSMMRYVAKVPGSIGFVVSQDKGIRVMAMLGSDLLMWDNIQLQQDFSFQGISEPSDGDGDTQQATPAD